MIINASKALSSTRITHLPMEPRSSRAHMSPSDRVSQLGLPNEFPPFFTPQLEQYRRSIAEGADAPDEFAVGFMLAAAATAAGADMSACVQPGWYIRSNVFIAVVGYKGSGKSTLAEKCFAPLVHREEELRDAIARPAAAYAADGCDLDEDDEDEDEGDDEYDDGYSDDDEDDEDVDADDVYEDTVDSLGRSVPEHPDPCVVVNDTTGPALLQLLEHNRRQLLVNADEMTALFANNAGGTTRQMWCELYDGRRRRRERASTKCKSSTLAAPYANVIGSVQPALLTMFYNKKGDDGLLDRFLLVGDGVMREAGWPRDADDPVLNTAWSTAMSRLLRIEEYASDAIGGQIESRFTPAALAVCKGLLDRLNNLAVVLDVPYSQRGIVKKLIQHSVKLALLHRGLRWAAGEFGDRGPLGDVDEEDAIAARDATLFFLGRWIVWRSELRGRGKALAVGTLGLSMPAGEDPALQSLSAVATDAQRAIGIIERIVRFLRSRGSQQAVLATLTAVQVLSDVAPDELRCACDWLVDNGHASWSDADRRAIRLVQPGPEVERGRREPISTATEGAK